MGLYVYFNIIDFDFIIMPHFSSLHPDVFWGNVARPVLEDILKNLFFDT